MYAAIGIWHFKRDHLQPIIDSTHTWFGDVSEYVEAEDNEIHFRAFVCQYEYQTFVRLLHKVGKNIKSLQLSDIWAVAEHVVDENERINLQSLNHLALKHCHLNAFIHCLQLPQMQLRHLEYKSFGDTVKTLPDEIAKCTRLHRVGFDCLVDIDVS
jgi:hypothetical protein